MERRDRPPADSWLDVVPPSSPLAAAVIAFSGHVVISAAVDRRWVESWIPHGDRSAPLNPLFLGALEERLRYTANDVDVVLTADAVSDRPELPLASPGREVAPTTLSARRYRTDVRSWAADGGVVSLARGLGGRWEVTIEVEEGRRDAGLGRALAAAARHVVPDGRPVWAQIPPGNPAGMRAFLAAGFRPVGAEILLTPRTC